MNLHDEFTRRVAADRLCAAVMKAVRENDTAALGRLGMRGFAQYAGRLSELMTECARRRLLGADDFGAIMDEDEDEDEDDFGAIMGEVAKPAHYAHHLVNEGGTAIQQALDRRNGVRLRVIEPEFDDRRLKGIVGEASESDSENAADNLAVQLGTMVKDMGNEFMRQNAEQRDRAGFKVTVTRTGGAKCCPWCADRTGKWELANAPDGVFGCHDNCKCMVDYTNSKGTVRGRAVTHKIDGKTVTKWEFADKIPYTPPRVLTREEAAARGGFDKPKRLTGGAKSGTMYADNGTGLLPPITEVPRMRFFANERINQVVTNAAQDIMHELRSHALGTEIADIINLAAPYSRHGLIIGEDGEMSVKIPLSEVASITIHNHPSGGSFSSEDIDRFVVDGKAKYMCAIGNNGKWYMLEKIGDFEYLEFYHKAKKAIKEDRLAEAVLSEVSNYGFKYYES